MDREEATVATELAQRIEVATSGAATIDTTIPGLRLSWLTTPLPPTSYLYGPSLCMCLRGGKQIGLSDRSVVHPPGSFLLTAMQMPIIVSIEKASTRAPYVGAQLALDIDVAREVIGKIDAAPVPQDAPGPGMMIGRLTEPLLVALLRLVRLMETPDDIPVMGDLIQREIIYRVASGPSGAWLRDIVRLGSAGHRVARAIAWLREHYSESLSIETLAREAGMGVSTLHRHFRQFTATSPIQYQKRLRLHAARRLLLTEDVDAATAAVLVGYESVSQFNREYRRLFGKPPRRDTDSLRLRRDHL